MKRRIWLGLAALALSAAVTMLGGAFATASVVTSGEQCNPTGRLMCLTVSTFSNITASQATAAGTRYTWVEWTLRNSGGTTLTHPTITVSLADFCGANTCTNPASTTAGFVLPDSANACVKSGTALTCTYPNLGAGASTPTTRVYFSTPLVPTTSSLITVNAIVKERANDANTCAAGDPNCDTFSQSVTNSYEQEGPNAYSFALPDKTFHLAATNELSSFNFTSKNPSIFFSQFKVEDPSSVLCFSDVPCFERILFADTQGSPGFSATNPVVFYGRVVPPSNKISAKNIVALHLYDAVTLQASAATNRFTGPTGATYDRIDGVSFGADAAAVIAAGKYFVVNPSGNSFQVSATKGGAPLSLLSSGAVQGSSLRIIGDQSDERSTKSCTTTPASINFPVPSICALDVKGQNAIDTWIWDTGNGRIGW